MFCRKIKIVSLYPVKTQEPYIVENPLRMWIITEKKNKQPMSKSTNTENFKMREAKKQRSIAMPHKLR